MTGMKRNDRGLKCMSSVTEKLKKIVKKENIYQNELMSKHTSFQIGGKADYFVKVESRRRVKSSITVSQRRANTFFCHWKWNEFVST